MHNIGNFELSFLKDDTSLKDNNLIILSVSSRESIFELHSTFILNCISTTNTIYIPNKNEVVALYYDGELQIKGILKRPEINYINKQITLEIVPITHLLSIQGINPNISYTQTDFLEIVRQCILDNIKGSKRATLKGYPAIEINGLKFGIIKPQKLNQITENDDVEDIFNRKPQSSSSIYQYIEKFANQFKVHVTTICSGEDTFLYFLDTGSIVRNSPLFLNNNIPVIKKEMLSDTNAFKTMIDDDKLYDKIVLFSKSSFEDLDDTGDAVGYNVNLNTLFKNLKHGRNEAQEFFTSFYRSSLDMQYTSYQNKQTIMQEDLMKTTGKFIAENSLASGLVYQINITQYKSNNNLRFYFGSYIDISDLFISFNYTTKTLPPEALVITGNAITYSKDNGFTQDIFIVPSFLLE